MENSLCSYCLEIFKNPVLMTGCCHSLCYSCVEKMYLFKLTEQSSPQTHELKVKQILSASPVTPTATTTQPTPSSTEKQSIEINCPECNAVSILNTKEGLSTLKRNDSLRNIVESLVQAPQCVGECGKQATTGCSNCTDAYCDECYLSNHVTAVMKKHSKAPLQSKAKNVKVPQCSVHQKKFTGFCTQCNIMICNTCTNFADCHQGHDKCFTLAQYKSQHEGSLKELQQKLLTAKPRIDQFIETENNPGIAQVAEEYEAATTAIKAAAQRMIEEVKKQEADLLAKAKSLKDVKERDLREQNKTLRLLSADITTATTKTISNPFEFGMVSQEVAKLSKFVEQHCELLNNSCAGLIRYMTKETVVLGNVVAPILPLPPVIKCTNMFKSCSLSWNHPQSDFKIIRFQLEVVSSTDGSSRRYDVDIGQYGSSYYSIDNLDHPEYKARVRAETEYGYGSWSDFNTLKPLQPPESAICNKEQTQLLVTLFNNTQWAGKKYDRIYRASEHNFSARAYNQHCNGKADLLTIVKSSNGNIFGGFSSVILDGSGHKRDAKAFLFSIVRARQTNLVKLPVNDHYIYSNNNAYGVYTNLNLGPTFGAGDLQIADQCNANNNSYSNLGNIYYAAGYSCGSNEAQNYLAGSHNFTCAEYEVFRLV